MGGYWSGFARARDFCFGPFWDVLVASKGHEIERLDETKFVAASRQYACIGALRQRSATDFEEQAPDVSPHLSANRSTDNFGLLS